MGMVVWRLPPNEGGVWILPANEAGVGTPREEGGGWIAFWTGIGGEPGGDWREFNDMKQGELQEQEGKRERAILMDPLRGGRMLVPPPRQSDHNFTMFKAISIR